MSFLKKMGFVKDTPEEEIVRVSASPKKVTPAAPTVPSGNTTEELTERYKKIILDECNAISKGFDYIKFAEALASLEGELMPEKQKFVSAFVAGKVMKVTPQDLVASAQIYLKKIDEQKEAFENDFAGSYKTLVEDAQKEVSTKEQEIELLLKQIEDKKQEIRTLNEGIEKSTKRLADKKSSFNTVYTDFKMKIESNVTKINSYLEN